MKVITEQLFAMVSDFIEGYRDRNFKVIWSNIHPKEQQRIQDFLENNHDFRELEEFVFEILDEKFINLPENNAIASNIRVNEFDVEFLLLVDEKHSGFYDGKISKPLKAVPLLIMKLNDEYRIKLYDD